MGYHGWHGWCCCAWFIAVWFLSVLSTPRKIDADPAGVMLENKDNGRFVFEYNGQKVYEWEQTLEEVSGSKIPSIPPGNSHVWQPFQGSFKNFPVLHFIGGICWSNEA